MPRVRVLLLAVFAACAPLSASQIADLERWSSYAATHCAAIGKCAPEIMCINATVAALDLRGRYDAAANLCRDYDVP